MRREILDDSLFEQLPDSGVDAMRAAERREDLELFDEALEALDLDQRAVFVLFEINNESCDEIARALEVPLGTVHSRLHAARAAFKKAHARLSKEGQP